MIGSGVAWGFIGGPPGIREVVVVALVALVLYGRSGVVRGLHHTRYGRVLRPWLATPRRTAGPSASRPRASSRRWADRWFWLLAVILVTAVGAWVATRLLIAGAAGSSP